MYYSGFEIVEIAVRIEENGHAFYSLAADMFRKPNETRGLFLDLASKELVHIAIFQKLAEKFEPENYDFSKEEASGYITNLADTHIFGKKDSGIDLAKKVKSPKEALEAALRFENDSVDFYTELAKRTHSDSQRLIQQIIDEEKEHAAEIKNFL